MSMESPTGSLDPDDQTADDQAADDLAADDQAADDQAADDQAADDPVGAGTVVIGFDTTDEGADALALGVRLAAATSQPAVVAVAFPSSPAGAGHVDAEWVAALREQADLALDRARSLVPEHPSVSYRLVACGSVAHGLSDLAEELGAAAIVVGSAPGGPLRRVLAGSTAERLLQGASVPVVVAPRGHRERATTALAAVGCGFVDTVDAHEALHAATQLARSASAKVIVYTVVAPSAEFALHGGRSAQRAYVDTARDTFRSAMDRAVAGLGDAVPVTTQVLEGNAVDALASLDDRDVDLLVVGSRGYGPVRRVLLGGTSSQLVRRAACPVMVVPRSAGGPLLAD